MKILALDLSLSSPGFAVISVYGGKVSLVDVISVKTDSKKSRGERLQHIEFALSRFINKHKPFDVVIREDFNSRVTNTSKAIYTVWGVTELVLSRFGYEVTGDINPKTVKALIGGSGNAEKIDVEEGVRKLLCLGDAFVFQTSDQSDACGIGLAYLIERNVIPPLYEKKKK